MSAKHTIFPPGTKPKASGLGDDDDLYTGHPATESEQPQEPPSPNVPRPPRGAAKGHAAYAAQDDIPAFTARSGFGPIGGLFADDAGAPAGHGVDAQQCGGDDLSAISHEILEQECRKRVCPHCPSKKETEDAHLRALADLDNAKKRLAREREEQVRFAAESVLGDIIPSLDNLDLALQHAGNLDACRDFVIGVQMTRKLLQDTLAKHGLAQTGQVGDEFDPAVHEAVGMVASPDHPDGNVCALLSSGYTLNGRMLRPAKVMVCKKG